VTAAKRLRPAPRSSTPSFRDLSFDWVAGDEPRRCRVPAQPTGVKTLRSTTAHGRNPMEPRAAPGPTTRRRRSTRSTPALRTGDARAARLHDGFPDDKIDVIAEDVGGGRRALHMYPELLRGASLREEDRSPGEVDRQPLEVFLSEEQGGRREHKRARAHARVNSCDAVSYIPTRRYPLDRPFVTRRACRCLTGVYEVPAGARASSSR